MAESSPPQQSNPTTTRVVTEDLAKMLQDNRSTLRLESIPPQKSILEGVGRVGKLRLPPQQKAAFYLACGVGLFAVLVISIIGIDWLQHLPPTPLSNSDPQVVENYKTLIDLAQSRATTMFDLVVVKAILPLFTTLLGYIFGARVAESKSQEDRGGESV